MISSNYQTPKLKLITLVLVFSFFLIHLNAQSGQYDIQFALGENKIPGSIHLCENGTVHNGLITVSLPGNQLNVAIESLSKTGNKIRFRTSSPIIDASLVSEGNQVSGYITLSGNRTFNFSGTQKSKKPEASWCESLSSKSYFAGSDNIGFAFPTISPDGKLLIFSAYEGSFAHQTLMYQSLLGDHWTKAEVLPFSGKFSDRAPSFSPDGKLLYFSSKRQADGISKEDYDIWAIKYKGKGNWGKPKPVKGINSSGNDYQPCFTKSGLYFTSEREDGQGDQDIYFAEGRKFTFSNPQNMGTSINSKHGEMSAFVNADESIMILASGNPELKTKGNDDLYLFKKQNGAWVFDKPLGENINSFANEYGAFLSQDGKWLYFTSDVKPFAKIYKIRWAE